MEGSDDMTRNEEAEMKAIINAANAGVIFSAAAGNASRGYEFNPFFYLPPS